MVILRPYQDDAIVKLRQSIRSGHKRLVLCSPTGSGKTVMFMFMVSEHLKKGGKALIVTDRIELMAQSDGALKKLEVQADLIEAGSKPDLTHNVHIAMVETLHRRVEKYSEFLASKTLVIYDECHKQSFNKLFNYISDRTVVIGATATPYRNGSQTSLSDYYTDLVEVTTTAELIKLGYLSEANSYGVEVDLSKVKMKGDDYDPESMGSMYSENKVYRGVIENYNRICRGSKALVFASNISSSQELAYAAGTNWKHLDSYMPTWERKQILEWFYNTPNAVLSNVGILTTGFDCPDIETIIMYRATKSLPLFLQMCGRGSRVTDAKKKFRILDFGNNIKRHGFWEDNRVWSLEKSKKKTGKKDGVAPVKICPQCGGIVPMATKICTLVIDEIECGFIFPSKEIKKAERVDLQLLTKDEINKLYNEGGVEKLAELCKSKVLKPFAVLHRLKTYSEGARFIGLMGYKKWFIHFNRDRFNCLRSS